MSPKQLAYSLGIYFSEARQLGKAELDPIDATDLTAISRRESTKTQLGNRYLILRMVN